MRCIALDSDTIIMPKLPSIAMKYKSKINQLSIDTEAVKEIDLDEQARPTRKLERPTTPAVDSATTLIHRRIKGTRRIR